MILSLYHYFPLRIQCNETVSAFMYAIQKPAAEKILVKGLQISEHMLLRHHVLHHVITTIHAIRVVNHIPMVRKQYLQLGSSKKCLQCIIKCLQCAL